MKRVVLLTLLTALPAFGHAISISTGDAVIHGKRIEYILRMPQYELKDGTPALLLFTQLQFRSNGEAARLVDAECRLDPAKNQYLCAANYLFARTPGDLEVQCSLPRVTVPNHVHMLKAERDGKFDQAILDSSIPSGLLTFRPATPTSVALGQITAAAVRMASSMAQLLLLAALAFSAASHRRRAWLAAAFFTGECVTVALLAHSTWLPSPRFAEAAAALGLTYLAVELAAWPKSDGRWLLALSFGGFSGLYFTVFLRESGFQTGYVLAGSILPGAVLFAACGMLRHRLDRAQWMNRWRAKAAKIATFGLLAGSALWFFQLLRSEPKI